MHSERRLKRTARDEWPIDAAMDRHYETRTSSGTVDGSRVFAHKGHALYFRAPEGVFRSDSRQKRGGQGRSALLPLLEFVAPLPAIARLRR